MRVKRGCWWWWRKVMIGSRQGHDTLRLRLNWDISYRWRTRDECLTLDRYKVGGRRHAENSGSDTHKLYNLNKDLPIKVL